MRPEIGKAQNRMKKKHSGLRDEKEVLPNASYLRVKPERHWRKFVTYPISTHDTKIVIR